MALQPLNNYSDPVTQGNDVWLNTSYGSVQNANWGNQNFLDRWFDPGGSDQVFNAAQAERDKVFNHNEAVYNRDWQAHMSNTEVQRRVADMKAAGLNPYALYNSGQAASSGSGATASSGGGARSNSSGMPGFITAIVQSAFQLATAAIGKKPSRTIIDHNYNWTKR